MSGGSYSYLCRVVDLDDLLEKRVSLQEMADRLAGLGYAEDAAKETEELVVLLNQWRVRAEVRMSRLAEVWKAVEWWDSSDCGEEDVREALAKYRGELQPLQGGGKCPRCSHPAHDGFCGVTEGILQCACTGDVIPV